MDEGNLRVRFGPSNPSDAAKEQHESSDGSRLNKKSQGVTARTEAPQRSVRPHDLRGRPTAARHDVVGWGGSCRIFSLVVVIKTKTCPFGQTVAVEGSQGRQHRTAVIPFCRY